MLFLCVVVVVVVIVIVICVIVVVVVHHKSKQVVDECVLLFVFQILDFKLFEIVIMWKCVGDQGTISTIDDRQDGAKDGLIDVENIDGDPLLHRNMDSV